MNKNIFSWANNEKSFDLVEQNLVSEDQNLMYNIMKDDFGAYVEEVLSAEQIVSTDEIDKAIACLGRAPSVAWYMAALYHLDFLKENNVDVALYEEVLSLRMLQRCALADVVYAVGMFDYSSDREDYQTLLSAIGIAKGLGLDVSQYMDFIADAWIRLGISAAEAQAMQEEYLVPREKEYAAYLEQLK